MLSELRTIANVRRIFDLLHQAYRLGKTSQQTSNAIDQLHLWSYILGVRPRQHSEITKPIQHAIKHLLNFDLKPDPVHPDNNRNRRRRATTRHQQNPQQSKHAIIPNPLANQLQQATQHMVEKFKELSTFLQDNPTTPYQRKSFHSRPVQTPSRRRHPPMPNRLKPPSQENDIAYDDYNAATTSTLNNP